MAAATDAENTTEGPDHRVPFRHGGARGVLEFYSCETERAPKSGRHLKMLAQCRMRLAGITVGCLELRLDTQVGQVTLTYPPDVPARQPLTRAWASQSVWVDRQLREKIIRAYMDAVGGPLGVHDAPEP